METERDSTPGMGGFMKASAFLLFVVGLSSPLSLSPVPAHAERPDVVVFLADDLGLADCSPFGPTDARTPNMARLAAEGMTFTHAFVASPSCAPSRGALLTGLDPMRNGSMLNHARPRADVKTWPAYFHDLGYEVAAIGKTAHYQQVTTYGFDHVGHYKYHDDACVEAAVAWLEKRGRRPDRPLCLLVGTNWPHVPWPARSRFDPSAVSIPPIHLDTPATRRARARYLEAVWNADRDLGLVYDAARKVLGPDALFLFSADHGPQFPFGKWNGYDYGTRAPLIVAWPGRVEAGATTDAMVSWTDILPTCLEAAGGPVPKGLSGRSFLGVLEGKTDRHRAEVFVTHSADGEMNRYPLRAVRTDRWLYIRNLDPAAEHHTHVDRGKLGTDGRGYWDSWAELARTDPHAAAVVGRHHHRPAEELYDTKADPWQLKDLAADPSHAQTLATLRADLDRWMAEQGDRGLETERALLEAGRRK